MYGGHTGSSYYFDDILNDFWAYHFPTRTWSKVEQLNKLPYPNITGKKIIRIIS